MQKATPTDKEQEYSQVSAKASANKPEESKSKCNLKKLSVGQKPIFFYYIITENPPFLNLKDARFWGHFCKRKNRAFRTSASLRSIVLHRKTTPSAVLQSLPQKLTKILVFVKKRLKFHTNENLTFFNVIMAL